MDIEGFWKDAPDKTYDVELLWNKFIESTEGERVDKLISSSPEFTNADYIFMKDNVVIELKEIVTDFMNSPSFMKKFIELMKKLTDENPDWKPSMLGGDGSMPNWFGPAFVRICRNPLDGILKKANKQLRETKKFFDITNDRGIVVIVNDGFTSLEHKYIQAVIANLLEHSYSSIDCLIYTTVNRYVDIKNVDTPSLLWVPMYSNKSPDYLVDFVNNLGRDWGDFLEQEMGHFTYREESSNPDFIHTAKSILLPDEKKNQFF